MAVSLLGFGCQGPSSRAIAPERPRQSVDTTPVAASGRTIVVPAHGDFQAALNEASPGDVIALAAGATYGGPFTLPNKPGAGWIIVRSGAPDSAFPPPGTRVDPSYAPVMPKIVAGPSGSAIQTASGAHHFRFVGVEVRPAPGVFVVTLIGLGAGETAVDALPHDIIFDRCYIHGDPAVGGRFGIAMNSAATAVIDSYLSGFADTRTDATAIWVTNGSGPFKIANNYLEGTGESLMFGGQDPSIPNLVPADVEVRGNRLAKPLSWRLGDPAYAGVQWLVKNLFELKNARRVLVDGNIFEYNWPDEPASGQDGAAILLTPRNQNGGAPWSTVEDVTFTHNIVRHSTQGILIFGTDNLHPSQQTNRVLIQDNLFIDIGAFPEMPRLWGAAGAFIALGHGNGAPLSVIVDHNTAFQSGAIIINDATPTRFVFTNNIASSGTGLSTPSPLPSGLVFKRNVIIGGDPSRYAPDNLFPSTLVQVGFVDPAGGDYRLALSSPYKSAGSDGKDIGADAATVKAAIASWVGAAPRP